MCKKSEFETLDNMSAVERIRIVLEEEINSGVRPPGELLDELELMTRFDVSRTPVRTAILQLASHGLITIVPRSGTYVSRMSAQELLAMLEVLAEMEASSAKLAARRMSPDDRQKLKAIHEQAERFVETEDVQSYDAYNAEWHGLIYEGSLNPYLTKQILYMRQRTKVYRRSVFQEPGRIRISYAEHSVISDAIVNGDIDKAQQSMLEHLAGSTKDFLQLLARVPGLKD